MHDKELIMNHLRASIDEEGQAIGAYSARSTLAGHRGYPEVAKLYDHIAADEEHHRSELQSMLDKLEGK